MKLSIQTIDLAKWLSKTTTDEERKAMAGSWHAAFKSHGLVYLINHGLQDSQRKVCREWLRFCDLDQAKSRLIIQLPLSNHF